MKPNIWEAIMLVLLVVSIYVLVNRSGELSDLQCRVARMETLAVSAEPLPDCEEETTNAEQDREEKPLAGGGVSAGRQ